MAFATMCGTAAGEQGDRLMPAVYALAQHPAVAAVQRRLQESKVLFAFLDDIMLSQRLSGFALCWMPSRKIAGPRRDRADLA